MNVDERDTRLGDLLDRAVRGIEAAGEPGAAERRGSSRRTGVLVASVTAVGVFLAAVGFAATQVGRDAGSKPTIPEGWSTLSAPDIPWTMPVPEGWRVGAGRFVGGPQHMIQDMRWSFVTNAATGNPRSFPSFGGPFRGQAEDGDVAIMVDQFVGQGEARPTSLTFNAVHRIPGAEGWTSRDGKICSEWGCVRVYLAHGPDASRSDLDAANRVAEGVRPERVAPSPTTLVPTIRYEDQDLSAGFSLEYPAGWVVADDPLADLLDPSEVVSIGTYDLAPGGRTRQGFDAVIPAALDQLGPEDVFITVQEYEGARPGGAPIRPEAFSPQAVCSDQACVDGRGVGLDGMRAWWVSFHDTASGRTFSALVAMGQGAFEDPARNAAAWAILDSLEFDPTDAPVAFPVPALGDYAFVPVQGGGSRIWPRSGSADIGVRYRFEVGHCGLAHITDFDGSFWQPILRHPLGADSPSVLINSDRGTIRMWESRHAVYTASTGQEVGLLRIDGPIVVGGCD